jgi:hypothetical protein
VNKKQIIAIVIAGIIIAFFFGYKSSPSDSSDHHWEVSIYGKYVGSVPPALPPEFRSPYEYYGNSPYPVIIATLIIGIIVVYTLRDK